MENSKYDFLLKERALSALKLIQKPHIIFIEQTDVVDLVFEHGDALNSHSESEAGIFFAVDFAIL